MSHGQTRPWIRRALRSFLLLGAAALCGAVSAFDGSWSTLPAAEQRPQIGVYLFLWYRPTSAGWGNGSTLVSAGAPRPELGWYDSSRPEVLRAQVENIASTGFDFAIVNLVAGDDRMWDIVTTLYREAEGSPLKLAVMVDGLYRASRTVQEASLRRARDRFGRHPNAFWFEGKPLMLSFSSFGPVTVEGVTVRNVYWSPDYRNGFNPFYRGRTPTSPTYPVDWPFWGPGPPLVNGVVPVIPGYDDRSLGRETAIYHPREDGRLYAAQWEHALRQRPDIITVYSWNEHFEQTAIEPTEAWGRRYLDMTREFIQRAKAGRAAP